MASAFPTRLGLNEKPPSLLLYATNPEAHPQVLTGLDFCFAGALGQHQRAGAPRRGESRRRSPGLASAAGTQ